MFGRCHQVGGVNLKPDFVHFQQKQKNLVQDGTPCCLTRVLIWEDCKHLAVITAHSMWSLWPQWDEEMHVLKVGMSEPEGARANLQHRMLILTADRRMATHVGCVQSAQVSVVFWIKNSLPRHPVQFTYAVSPRHDPWMHSVLTQVVIVSVPELSPCCQSLRRSSGLHSHPLTPNPEWHQTPAMGGNTSHTYCSFSTLCPSAGQGHDAEALMGKPDAHIDKHTHTYQTNVMHIQ